MSAGPSNDHPAGAAGCLECPRRCQAGRTPQSPGRCGVCAPPGLFRVARIMAHPYEEPYISGGKGSGAVFFSGCALHCVFCQNDPISRLLAGRDLTQAELAAAIRRLADSGVANINLVTGSHYIASLPPLLAELRTPERTVGSPGRPMPPILWNSSAYETVQGLQGLAGLVDIYLPDLKFVDGGLSREIAGAADYFDVASAAIAEMVRQQPQAAFDGEGMLTRGTAVRHLVLPGQWRDSIRVIDALAALVPLDTPLSIMSQYTPPQLQESWPSREAARDRADAWWRLPPELARSLGRRLTTYEYEKVLDHAVRRGFSRVLSQARTSADSRYTPDFLLRDG